MADSRPTGQHYELRYADQLAVVVEVGGGLRRYAASGHEVLDGFAGDQRPDGGRGQLLVPWPNRVRDGRYRWQGSDLQLALTEPEAHNAIHGLLRWTSWAVREVDRSRVVVGTTLWPQPGYPFQLDVEAEYSLGPDGLSVRISARNEGQASAPYGVGQHPYFRVGAGLIDEALLTIPASGRLAIDERGTPVSTEPVAGTPYDFRTPRRIGGVRLDTAFTMLLRDGRGRAVVRLADRDGAGGVDVWLGAGADHVQVYTGDMLPDPRRRRQGLAVEPMSCQPDAFRTGEGLVELAPGDSHDMHWGATPWLRPRG